MKKALLFICTLLTISSAALPVCAMEDSCGDEIAVTESITTKQSEVSPCQVNLSLNADEAFTLSVYAEIQNTDTGNIYRLNLYHDNKYMDKCFVEEGNYKVLEIASYEDSTGTYSFTYPEDFSIKSGDTIDLVTMISEKEAETPDIKRELIEQDSSYESDFDVFHEGSGLGQIAIEGTQNGRYELAIKITSSGVPGGFSIKYSLDDGSTWSDEKLVPLHGSLELFSQTENGNSISTGLTARFIIDNATDATPFVMGDYYYAHISDPKTSVVSDHIGDSSVEMEITTLDSSKLLYDILSDNNLSFYVRVLKSGMAGESVIEISLDGGKTFMEERITPRTALNFEELGLKMTFPLSDTYQLKEGDVYKVYPYKMNYVKAYILAVVILLLTFSFIIASYLYLRSKIPGDDEWHIRIYEPDFYLPPIDQEA
ncbi:hypothetical protein [Butyrivibrio sp. INlla16]|uniref:hypothetical protein n=1 Tax=Butyrivibrio sp. INlla16 TaxID=1520807 RepID=UPI00088ACD75|nr:hypothetical protein [Butyrivibrio sp. INlla16]SDB69686.1 type I secretion C-terminal target domain (VC_A0849 subclass) [Butyrivibrio sp. INlla16]